MALGTNDVRSNRTGTITLTHLGSPNQIKKPKALYTHIFILIYMEIPMKAELEKEFREKAMQLKGYRRGAFKEALEEAIEDWLAKIAPQGEKGGEKRKNEM